MSLKSWMIEGAKQKDGIRRRNVAKKVAGKLTEWMEGNCMKSWKTTVFGILGAGGAYLMTVNDPAWMQNVGGILAAVGTAGLGMAARDNNVTSEQAKAGEKKP